MNAKSKIQYLSKMSYGEIHIVPVKYLFKEIKLVCEDSVWFREVIPTELYKEACEHYYVTEFTIHSVIDGEPCIELVDRKEL